MSASTDQRIGLEDAVFEVLDAGDTEQELRDHVDSAIESWKSDNPVGDEEEENA